MNRIVFFSILILVASTQVSAQKINDLIIRKALFKNNLQILENLIKDFNMQIDDTPLLSWVILTGMPGEINFIKFLLSKGAKIDAQEQKEGFTALLRATKMGLGDIVKILLDAGADPLIKNKEGLTALNLVKKEISQYKSSPTSLPKKFRSRLLGPQTSMDKLKAIEKMLESAEQSAKLTKTVKQMELPKKAIQTNLGGTMGELGKEVEKYL